MSPRPNLFIVGAPRCGTTRLHADLSRHPQVFMPARKEPHFFCTDINDAFERYQGRPQPHLLRDMESYLSLFEAAGDARVIGESSVYYLYSEAALAGIRAFDPDARILVLLREPVEFLHSLHGRLYSMIDETQPFERALELEPARRAGRSIPRTVRYPGLLHYSDFASFSERIVRWRETFSESQVRVVLLDDLRSRREETWASILSFLEVDPFPPPTDTPRNENVEARSRWLAQRLRRRWLAGRWTRIDRRLERLNTRQARRRPLDPAVRARLRQRFQPEVTRLSELLERDLLALWGYAERV